MKTIVDIKRTLEDRHLTLTAFAEAVGIAKTSVYSYMKGNLRLDTLQKIADALHCDILDLFYRVDDDGTVQTMANEIAQHEQNCEQLVKARYESEISRLKAEIAKLQMQIPEIKPEISKNQGKISSDGSILDTPAYADGLPIGSVRQGAKTYICPNCGTKFAILND